VRQNQNYNAFSAKDVLIFHKVTENVDLHDTHTHTNTSISFSVIVLFRYVPCTI